MSKASKKTSESQVSMAELVLPNDANLQGGMLGGRVMHIIDIAASMAAMKHCRKPVVTVAVDSLDFRYPVKVGHMILLHASVNYTDRSSMEIGVRVETENPISGETHHTSSAYLTFVALDDHGRPTGVPKVIPETDTEKRRYVDAKQRRAHRIKQLEKRRESSRR